MNCTAFTYYVTLINGQMHVCLIASSVENCYQVHCCRVPIQVSQDGFRLRLLCMFLGCDMPI